MLYTTFALAKKAGACKESYKKVTKALGGVSHYGKHTLIPLDKVLEVCGLNDALWALRFITKPADKEIRLLACDYAERVLPIFEKKYPRDNRLRQAIDISRKYANGEATSGELAAARDAAGAAVRAAAGAAAGDAEIAWQTQRFLEMLRNTE